MGNHSVQHSLKVLQIKLLDDFIKELRNYTDSIINSKTLIEPSNLGEQLVSLVEHQHFAFAHIRHLGVQSFRQGTGKCSKSCHRLDEMVKQDQIVSYLLLHEVKNPARGGDHEVDLLVDPHDVVLQVSSA